jgi:hypothetical protein
MAHTPGPWHWSDDGEGNKWGRKGLEPCVLYGTVEGLVSVYDADARLIAAAPALLAALQSIAEIGPSLDFVGVREFALAAIAQATAQATMTDQL